MSLVFGQEHVLCGSFNRPTDLKIGNGWTEVSYIKLFLSLLKRFHIWIDNVGRFLVTFTPGHFKDFDPFWLRDSFTRMKWSSVGRAVIFGRAVVMTKGKFSIFFLVKSGGKWIRISRKDHPRKFQSFGVVRCFERQTTRDDFNRERL